MAGYDAVFADGFMANAPTLPADLAGFVRGGGAVYVAGGTGTFSPANAATEAAYWQPFFTAATGSSDFGFGTNAIDALVYARTTRYPRAVELTHQAAAARGLRWATR